jgi:hypothetical protein
MALLEIGVSQPLRPGNALIDQLPKIPGRRKPFSLAQSIAMS